MRPSELRELLIKIEQAHPEAEVVEAFTPKGRASHQISIRVRKNRIIIQGDQVEQAPRPLSTGDEAP